MAEELSAADRPYPTLTAELQFRRMTALGDAFELAPPSESGRWSVKGRRVQKGECSQC
jgi:hypothetical protein